METILKSELDKAVKLGEVEVFTAAQIKAYVEQANNEIEKSIGDKAAQMSEVATEIKSFKPVKVWDDKTLEKSIQFVRPAQIKWDEPVGDDISKSRSGTYMNTPDNRKLSRVGRKYGKEGEKEKNEEADRRFHESEKAYKEHQGKRRNEGPSYDYDTRHKEVEEGKLDVQAGDILIDTEGREEKLSSGSIFNMPKFSDSLETPPHLAFIYGRHQLPKEIAIKNAKKFLEEVFIFRAKNKPVGEFEKDTFSANRLSDPNTAALLHGIPKEANEMFNSEGHDKVKAKYGEGVFSRLQANNIYQDLRRSPLVGGSYIQPADLSKFTSLIGLHLK